MEPRQLDIFVGQQSAEPTIGESVGLFAAFDSKLESTPAHVFNNCVEKSEAEWVAFSNNFLFSDVRDYEALSETLDARAECVAVFLAEQSPGRLTEIWQRYPPRLASLLCPPEQEATVIVNRRAVIDNGGFLDVSSPIWDWLIRAVCDRRSIAVVENDFQTRINHTDETSLPHLVPVRPKASRQWLLSHLMNARGSDLVPKVSTGTELVALQAGLFQIHGYLDESHRLSQSIEGEGRHSAGDYWHAIMHRREPDYSNSKYWFRRVGRHPIFEPLASRADVILQSCPSPNAQTWQYRLREPNGWDPFAFVDLCDECENSGDASLIRAVEEIQWVEMRLLFGQTYEDSTM